MDDRQTGYRERRNDAEAQKNTIALAMALVTIS
jgi:hypothetical protein